MNANPAAVGADYGQPPDRVVTYQTTSDGYVVPMSYGGGSHGQPPTHRNVGNPMAGGACSVRGHRVELGEAVEYVDGDIIACCERCGERVVFERVPGGMPVVQARSLATMIVASSIETKELMRLALHMEKRLREERVALTEAEQQLELAKRALAARVARGR